MPRPNWINDPTIPSDGHLWRGISTNTIKEVEGRLMPSTGSFITFDLSVSIAAETTQHRVIAKGAAHGYEWRLWEFPTIVPRTAGCYVDRDPILGQPDPARDDPAHAVVVHPDIIINPKKRITPTQAKAMVDAGRWSDEAK
jgi:hypothetical protein